MVRSPTTRSHIPIPAITPGMATIRRTITIHRTDTVITDRTVMDTGMHPDMAGPIVGDIAAGGEPSRASQHHSVACTFPIAVRRIGSTEIERACPTRTTALDRHDWGHTRRARLV